MSDPQSAADLQAYRLQDRYNARHGRVFLTGTQALVRVLLNQASSDRQAGLKTAGFVSGYRGSPLGAVDLELWRAKKLLAQNKIEFMPAVNEDLAATAVLGSQQVETSPDKQVDGVFGLWYGKGPGIDRSGDALKHGNAYGSSPTGGVLVVAGDDHGCVSSSMPHQSDVAFMSWFMPILNPASVSEYLSFGEYGFALSRFSGMWVGFKAISETVESGASVRLPEPRQFVDPSFEMPATGLHYRWPDLPGPQIEERMVDKKNAVFAFADANPIDRRLYENDGATYGIVTTGKAHHDLMEAMRLIGLDRAECIRLGIDIYKVGMVWPLARRDALDFVREKREILVVEEKRGIIESQFKEYFYDYPGHKPERMVGKNDENGARLVPWTGELSPIMLARIVASRIDALFPGHDFTARAARLGKGGELIQVAGATRTPYFCSGCPHNTSTKVPDGSKALAGIGCHFMASWMDRETSSLIQMGGEGVNWAASSKFTGGGHIFQNLGEGTYYHSGSMAIRQSVAAGANITYKILFNDAVAMTGGQPVDGPVSVHAIAHAVRAEGVARIALVSDQASKFNASELPADVTIHDRRDLDAVQRELRETQEVSVLIYEQTCATEKRRRRKRGTLDDPARFAYINEAVCEGCGDCSVESNCLSVEPRETWLGRKRQINLSSCNKDFSCVNGFCPSFVTVEGARRRPRSGLKVNAIELARCLPDPEIKPLPAPFDLLVTGVGGTGVVTVGALITMAAHLEGKGSTVLDFTGFAQKFGPVLSYIRLAESPAELHQVRIETASADAMIACDVVVSSSPKASAAYRSGMKAVVNTAEMPTGDIVRLRDARLRVPTRVSSIEALIGRGNLVSLDANRAAEGLMGDTVFANVMMLGLAWQQGLVPVSFKALMRAIELNDVAIEKNKQAFAWGRVASLKPELIDEHLGTGVNEPESFESTLRKQVDFLTQYQNATYAEQFKTFVDRLLSAQADAGAREFAKTAAAALFKLMSYKDEYEVARLHSDTGFLDKIKQQFEGDFKVNYHLAPPFIPNAIDSRGRPRKRTFGPWMQTPFKGLAKLKFLRGTRFDVFGYSDERKMERSLVGWYQSLLVQLTSGMNTENVAARTRIAALALDIRGYGPVKAESVDRVKAAVAQALSGAELSPPSEVSRPRENAPQ